MNTQKEKLVIRITKLPTSFIIEYGDNLVSCSKVDLVNELACVVAEIKREGKYKISRIITKKV